MDKVASALSILNDSKNLYNKIVSKTFEAIVDMELDDSFDQSMCDKYYEIFDESHKKISEIDMIIAEISKITDAIILTDGCLNDILQISYNSAISDGNNIIIAQNISKLFDKPVAIIVAN